MKPVLPFLTRSTALFVVLTGVALAGPAADQFGPENWGPGLGAGLGIGIAALGGGLGQGRTASAALEGMARNPQAAGSLFTPMMIALVLTETLVLFAFAVTASLAGLF